MSKGHVYILTNRGYAPNLLKIGMTTRTPAQRAQEMFEGATGVPYPFDIAFSHPVSDCAKAEQLIHVKLRQHRAVHYREFFEVDLQIAIHCMKEVCAEVNLESPGLAPSVTPKALRPYVPPPQDDRPRRNPDETMKMWISGVFSVLFILAMVRACSSFFK